MITRRSLLAFSALPPLVLLDTRFSLATQSNAASMSIEDIGLPEGVTNPSATRLNANGDVLVTALVDDISATYLYRSGTFARIGGDDAPVIGVALNDSGDAVGYSANDGEDTAVLIGADNLVTMPGGYRSARALAVNVEGVVAGEAKINDDDFARPVYWTESTIEVLQSIAGAGAGAVLHMNTIEQMVGWSGADDDNIASHATLWKNGDTSDLGTLGGNLSEARGINETGLIVGASLTSPDQNTFEEAGTAAFSWFDGQITDLGRGDEHVWAIANDVNDVGMIVGTAGLAETGAAGNSSVALLWADGEVLDLNQIASGVDGLTLIEAVSVNSFGQILCRAINAEGTARIAVLSVIGN